MSQQSVEISPAEVEAAARLIDAPERDAFSVLGIQAEYVELNEPRLAAGQEVPTWSGMESFDSVLRRQRGPALRRH